MVRTCPRLDLADTVAGSTQQQPVSEVVHYIIVRRLPRGLSEAYVGHAAADSVVTAPMPPGTRIVVLEVPDEQSLHGVAKALTAQSQGYALVALVFDLRRPGDGHRRGAHHRPASGPKGGVGLAARPMMSGVRWARNPPRSGRSHRSAPNPFMDPPLDQRSARKVRARWRIRHGWLTQMVRVPGLLTRESVVRSHHQPREGP